jgi:hypothetical protein
MMDFFAFITVLTLALTLTALTLTTLTGSATLGATPEWTSTFT